MLSEKSGGLYSGTPSRRRGVVLGFRFWIQGSSFKVWSRRKFSKGFGAKSKRTYRRRRALLALFSRVRGTEDEVRETTFHALLDVVACVIDELVSNGTREQGEFAVAFAIPRPLDLDSPAHLRGQTTIAVVAHCPRGAGHAPEVRSRVRIHACVADAVRLARPLTHILKIQCPSIFTIRVKSLYR